jgi:hypothetical protein
MQRPLINNQIPFAQIPIAHFSQQYFRNFLNNEILKNRQVGEKWVYDDCSYLCKGLNKKEKRV